VNKATNLPTNGKNVNPSMPATRLTIAMLLSNTVRAAAARLAA
jgi:5,10-methylene-tetrahydrofolate dehydrogenase/methenyl tetrahydrofolate cyclohydrolase